MNKSFVVVALLGVAALCAVGFAINYALGAQTQVAGVTLGVAFIAIAAALVVWEHELMPHDETVQDMPPQRSAEPEREAAVVAFSEGATTIVARRPWLVTILAGAAGAIGVALLFPLRSLTPKIGDKLATTSWSRGARLVRADGTLVKVSDLDVDSVVTVFPEGHVGPSDSSDMAIAATMLVRVPPGELELPAERAGWAPEGLLAYSKVCTHAGCPVALYRASARELFCPCHQSTFDVLRAGKRIFGPADRPLPQLPLRIAADGTLEAAGHFDEPIGPGYWERA